MFGNDAQFASKHECMHSEPACRKSFLRGWLRANGGVESPLGRQKKWTTTADVDIRVEGLNEAGMRPITTESYKVGVWFSSWLVRRFEAPGT